MEYFKNLFGGNNGGLAYTLGNNGNGSYTASNGSNSYTYGNAADAASALLSSSLLRSTSSSP